MAVNRFDGDAYTASDFERSDHPAPVRLESRDQIIKDRVDDVLVKDAFVTIGPQVEFERLRLDDPLSRNVFHRDRSEVGLAGGRAYTGELVGF